MSKSTKSGILIKIHQISFFFENRVKMEKKIKFFLIKRAQKQLKGTGNHDRVQKKKIVEKGHGSILFKECTKGPKMHFSPLED